MRSVPAAASKILENVDKARRLFRAFCACDRGAILVNFGLMVIPLVGMVGLGVDAGRGYVVKARLSQALDAAALASAPYVNDTTRLKEEFENYFYANFPKDFMGAEITLGTPVVGAQKTKVSVTASAVVGTTLMNVLGIEDMEVAASAEVTRLITPLDVVISIDTTGSMGSSDGSGTRLSSARGASHLLIDKLFGEETVSENLQVALVPWSASVNVAYRGVSYNSALNQQIGGLWYTNNSPVPFRTRPDNDWQGCSYARYTDNGVADDADHLLYDASVGGVNWNSWDPMPRRVVNPGNGSLQTATCPSWGISALSGTKSTTTSAVNALTSPNGTTNIAQGLVWSWRTLMPGNPFNEASSKSNLRRAIVIMTDGMNTTSYRDAYRGHLNTGEMDDRLEAVAAQVKSSGVDIYVVEYHVETNLMKSVASAPTAPFYFHASSSDELEKAFDKIGTELSELRVSR
ncbi:VWA domain-containing protein [Kiloniella laminariae]|uniref:VWA domain-containing protein n=1 Tax=Kiloniella laminariae TaxID=454162 RepID=UPI0003638D47|nr:VWA domain-containing protein [Kiloniella laminariae]